MRHLIDTYIEADAAADNFGLRRDRAARLDREERHRRGHRQPTGRYQGQQGRGGGDDRQQCPQQDHQGTPQRPRVLREDVRSAERDPRRPQGQRIDYEEFLKRIAELCEASAGGQGGRHAGELNTPGKRALFNNLSQDEALALKIDETVRRVRPNAFRGIRRRRTSSRPPCFRFWATTARGGAGLPHYQGAKGILMRTQVQLGDIARGRGSKGHQERPFERPPADRTGADRRPDAHEPRHGPRFRHCETGWIKQTAAKAAGAGARDAPRVSRPGKPLRLGTAVSAQGHRGRSADLGGAEPGRMVFACVRARNQPKRQAIVEEWYREQFGRPCPPLIAKWERLMGVKVERFFVQRMKTKWGSCNPLAGTIRLNTDLAKKPPGMPRIHCRPRDGPPARADAQRAVHGD